MPLTDPFDLYAAEYDRWFEENQELYLAELAAVRSLLPPAGEGLEVGVGTGRFAAPLGIKTGVEPSPAMAELAKKRGIKVYPGVAENLPFAAATFDFVLMVTVICFLDDVAAAFREAHRVLKKGGALIVAFLDRETAPGRELEKKKERSKYYQKARFRSAAEVERYLTAAGLTPISSRQVIMEKNGRPVMVEGTGQGLFAVIAARKQ
ncbi:MAG: hypothetical protein PWQ31_1102 [Eubacteriales bacterium]|nr:hypothetical protein [Eubacteriales bacterium]